MDTNYTGDAAASYSQVNINSTTPMFINTTVPRGEPEAMFGAIVRQVMSILLLVIMVTVMASLGCSINLPDLKSQLRRPVAIIIGMVCQFLIYPPSVYGLAHLLQLEKWDALGMIMIATCPGGHISNIITYWTEGNVALSVSMTASATAIGIGMMPLNLWIYSRTWTDDTTVVPYKNIVIALACLVLPVPVGMFILRKWPKLAVWVARIGSTLGFLMIVVYLIMAGIEYTDLLKTSWRMWFGAFFLPVQGLVLGYIVTSILCRPPDIKRTVAIEVSSQNVGICLTIINLSFSSDIRLRIMTFPLLFGFTTSTVLLAFTLCYRIYKLFRARRYLKVDQRREMKELGRPSGITSSIQMIESSQVEQR